MNQQQQGGSADNEMNFIYVSAIIVLVLLIAGYFLHNYIVDGVFFLKAQELKLLGLFTHRNDGLLLWIQMTPDKAVTYRELAALSWDIGLTLRLPFAITSLGLALILSFYHPARGYCAVESMKTLAGKLRDDFPVIKTVDELDLISQSIDKGPWAMALTPIEFAKKNKLIYRDKKSGKVLVHKFKAKMLFVEQLGRRWIGIDDLTNYERAIFAALLLYVNYKREKAENLLMSISSSVTQAKLKKANLDYSGVNAAIRKYGESKAATQVIEKHAYVLTVFSAMLEQARQTGIVANSFYLWVKAVDRKLWYSLNNVGRKAVYIEAAATRAQFLAEKEFEQPIKEPVIDEAVNGLVVAVQERIIKDI